MKSETSRLEKRQWSRLRRGVEAFKLLIGTLGCLMLLMQIVAPDLAWLAGEAFQSEKLRSIAMRMGKRAPASTTPNWGSFQVAPWDEPGSPIHRDR